MSHTFFIRPASLEDFPVLSNILNNTPCDWTPTILADCFSDGDLIWVILFYDAIAGLVVVKNNVDCWEILQFVIDRCYQRQGLASALLQFVIENAIQKHMQKIALEVRPSNHAAIALYQKIGFTRVGVRKKYYSDGEDAVLMEYITFHP